MIAYQLFEGVPPFYTLDPVEAARAAALEHKRPPWGANKKGLVSVKLVVWGSVIAFLLPF
jgi:hypothetical protein